MEGRASPRVSRKITLLDVDYLPSLISNNLFVAKNAIHREMVGEIYTPRLTRTAHCHYIPHLSFLSLLHLHPCHILGSIYFKLDQRKGKEFTLKDKQHGF